MSRFFENNIEGIRSNLILMGQKVIDSVELSIEAIKEGNPSFRKVIKSKDDEIDSLENQIVSDITIHLSTHAPVAADLRFLVTAMKVSHELERVGDEAKAIVRRAQKAMNGHLNHIPEMAEITLSMIKEAIDVFVEFDKDRTEAIWSRDITVDHLNRENNEFFGELVSRDPALASSVFEMVFISKSLERIGDHAVSISKEIVFMATSKGVRHAEKYKKAALRKKLENS